MDGEHIKESLILEAGVPYTKAEVVKDPDPEVVPPVTRWPEVKIPGSDLHHRNHRVCFGRERTEAGKM